MLRREESVSAAMIMGMPEPAFWGYPDTGLAEAWSSKRRGEDDAVIGRSDFSSCEEYCGCGRGFGAGPETDLTARTITRRLERLLSGLPQDSLVATTHHLDGHPDHAALGEFVREVNGMLDKPLRLALSVLHARDDRGHGHADCWYPAPASPVCYSVEEFEADLHPELIHSMRFHRTHRNWRQSLPDDALYGEPAQVCLSEMAAELKPHAIEAFGTQIGTKGRAADLPHKERKGILDSNGYLAAFGRKTEVFVLDPTDIQGLDPLAVSNGGGGEDQEEKQSLLVVQNVRIRSEGAVLSEIRRIKEDYPAVCGVGVHSRCQWVVAIVLENHDLEKTFHEASSELPPNIKWQTKVHTKNFNKFLLARSLLGEMMNWDLVLFKDSDMRLNSLSWHTFLEKRSDAILSGPMRRDVDCASPRSWYPFFRACHHESAQSPGWSQDLYDNTIPIELPFLEMSFVLFDAKFANFFFNLALRPSLINFMSDYPMDNIWCPAAKVFDNSRPSCLFIPIVSTHEDTRTIEVNDELSSEHDQVFKVYTADAILGRWFNYAMKWFDVTTKADLHQIGHSCRDLLDLDQVEYTEMADSADFLQACARKTWELGSEGIDDGYRTLQLIIDQMRSAEILPRDSSAEKKMLNEAKNRLEERLRMGGDKN